MFTSLLRGGLYLPVNAASIVGRVATSQALQGAIMKGSVEGLSSKDPNYVLNETFMITLNTNPKAEATMLAISSTIFATGTWWVAQKAEFGRRALLINQFLALLSKDLEEIPKSLVGLGEELDKLSIEVFADDIEKIQSIKTAKLQAELVVLRQRMNDVQALNLAIQYINQLEYNPQLKGSLTTVLQSGGGKYSDEALQIIGEMVNSPPSWLDNATVKTIQSVFDVNDIMGITHTMEKMDGLIASTFGIQQGIMTNIDRLVYSVDEFNEVMASGEDLDDIIQYAQQYSDNMIEAIDDIKAQGASASYLAEEAVDLSGKTKNISKASVKAGKIAQKARWASLVSKVNIIDLVWWGISLGIDVALNPFMPEENQKIPYLSDIPYIGTLFDLSDKAGSSPIGDLMIVPFVENVVGLFSDEEVETIYKSFIVMMLAATQAPLIGDMITMILDWWIDISFSIDVNLGFDRELEWEAIAPDLTMFLPKLEPMIILEGFIYAIVIKVVVMQWIIPLWGEVGRSIVG